MEYKSVKGFTGLGQLGILFVFVGLGFVLMAGVQLFVGIKLLPPGTSSHDMGGAMLKALLDPKNVGIARFLQVLGTFLLLFVPALLYSWVANGRNNFWLGFNGYFNAKQIAIGFVILFLANIIAGPLFDLSKFLVSYLPSLDAAAKQLEQAYNDQVLAMSNLKSWSEFIIAIFIMAFFPALFEEVFFRGTVQNLLVRWWKAPLVAIIVSSLLFSFIHMSIYLFASRALLGFALGMIYYQTKNIWVNVMAHFLNNLIALMQLFFMGSQQKDINPDKLNPVLPWWIGLIALALLIFAFKILDKYSFQNREKIMAKEKSILAKDNVYDPFSPVENS